VSSLWPAVAPLLEAVRAPGDLTFVSYSDVVVARPYCPDLGLAVIGDGAHGTSPQLGQGANLALIDALTLADALKAGSTVDAALAAHGNSLRALIMKLEGLTGEEIVKRELATGVPLVYELDDAGKVVSYRALEG
jgi:2-polyprenyl-6-methoxyphenol hydroxylase-like FAD-dependent oxidoreductase